MSDEWWTAKDAQRAREQDGLNLPPCVFCGTPFDGTELQLMVWDRTFAHESCQHKEAVHPHGAKHQN